MAETDQKDTSTVEPKAEELEKATNAEAEDKNPDLPPASEEGAGENEAEAEEADSGADGEDEGAKEVAPTKKDNRSGYLIRQLTNQNPNIQRLRTSLQSYVDAADDEGAAKERQREVNDYIKDTARVHDDLVRDNEQVSREIPEFNPGSPRFNPELTRRMYAQFARDMAETDQNGITDANGNPIIIGYRMRLIDYAREKAEDYGFGSNTNQSPGKPKAQSNQTDKSNKAKAKMDAAGDTPGGTSGTRSKGKEEKDPFEAGFDDPYGRHAPENAHAYSEK